MTEYNIYAGLKGNITYQETEEFETQQEALDRGRDIAHADAEAFGWNPDDLEWKAIPFEEDNIPEDMRAGSRYL